MAEETQRMGIPYPSENDDPWWTGFVDFVRSLDSHHFASFEDRNIFFLEGGTFSWLDGTLEWTAGLKIISPSTGIMSTLASGTLDMDDGDFMVVDLTRGPTTSVALSVQSIAQIDPDDAPMVVCVRNGDKLYFRNGAVLDDTDSAQVFDEGPSASVSRVDRLDSFTGDGITSDFTLTYTPNADSIPFVFQDGIFKQLTTDYSFPAATTARFVSPPGFGENITVRYFT